MSATGRCPDATPALRGGPIDERRELGHPGLDADLLVRARWAARRSEDAPVGRHERDIRLGVAAVDGEHGSTRGASRASGARR